MANDPKLLKLFAQESALMVHRDVMRGFIKQGLTLEQTLEQPKMKEIAELLSFDLHYYQQVYEKEFIYLWAFQGKFNIDYFISTISSFPDDINEKTTYTLLGETKDDKGMYHLSEDLKALEKMVYDRHLSIYYILLGGGHWNDYGKTPKERLLKVLNTLRTTWLNQQVVTEPWDTKHNNAKHFNC